MDLSQRFVLGLISARTLDQFGSAAASRQPAVVIPMGLIPMGLIPVGLIPVGLVRS